MTEFGRFYQQGGVFMHLVTLLSLAAAGILVRRAARLRTLARQVTTVATTARPASRPTPEGPYTGLVLAVVMVGGLGTAVGVMQACSALLTIPPGQHALALLRALPIALSPLVWSLALGTPLVLGRATVSSIEARLRALAPSR